MTCSARRRGREFLRGYGIASALLPEGPPQDSAALQAYPLYPYLQAARLRRELRVAPDPNAVDRTHCSVPQGQR